MESDQPILILDNGAHTIKTAWSNSTKIHEYRNAIVKSKTDRRNYVGDELNSECNDFGGLMFKLPFERGILTNWDAEKTVWDRVFGGKGNGMRIDPSTTSLLITEPIFNLPNVQDNYDQIIFEEYEFENYLRLPGPSLLPYGADALGESKDAPECVLIVDSGFSFTHIIPIVKGRIISSGVRRIDIGGKLLTNHLKELISFRQWYMMDQTCVIEKVKEDCCYVTTQWEKDLMIANQSKDNSIVQTYVLPDFVPSSSNKLGYLRIPSTGLTPEPEPVVGIAVEDQAMDVDSEIDPTASISRKDKGKGKEVVEEEEQLLQMSNERFSIPEVLFNPSTIGLAQGGIPETISNSINSLPIELRGMFWNNIVCAGGNTGFKGFNPRLQSELRHLAPSEFSIRVTSSASPTHSIIQSAISALSPNLNPIQNNILRERFVSREEYQEMGSNASRRNFAQAYWSDGELGEDLLR